MVLAVCLMIYRPFVLQHARNSGLSGAINSSVTWISTVWWMLNAVDAAVASGCC
jgi:hypothetical protein